MGGFFFVTFLLVLSGYPVLGQNSRYQHNIIYIYINQDIDYVDGYVSNHFYFPLSIMNELVINELIFKC